MFLREHPFCLFWLHFPRKQLLYLFSLLSWREDQHFTVLETFHQFSGGVQRLGKMQVILFQGMLLCKVIHLSY